MIKNEISIDGLVQRYIVAIDEIGFCGEQLKELAMNRGDEAESVRVIAKDYLDGLCERVEGMLEEIQLMKDDAEAE